TVGNWSDGSLLGGGTPYVTTLSSGGKDLEGSQGYWGKFRDVFDPSFEVETRRRIAAGARPSAADPWCIGYFVDNEISWGEELSLAEAALASPAEEAAKRAFREDLRARHRSIEALNAAWGTRHASWDALLSSREVPDRQRARADLAAFAERTAD